jgi:hypothetical protein
LRQEMLTDLPMFRPLRTLRKQRRPNRTPHRHMTGIHDPDGPGLVKVLRVEFDRVSFLVVWDVGHWDGVSADE